MSRKDLTRRELLWKCAAVGSLTVIPSLSFDEVLWAWHQSEQPPRKPTPWNEIGPFYKREAPHSAELRKPGDPAPTAGVTDSVTPSTGATGKTIARQVTTTVTIMAVDASVPSVTVKTAKGNVLSFRVQDPKRLEGIKAGDTVDVTYTQAILVSVEPVAK